MRRVRFHRSCGDIIYIGSSLVLLTIMVASLVFLVRTHEAVRPRGYYRQRNNMGMSMGNLAGVPAYQINRDMADMSRLGFTRIRFDINWSDVQPSGPSQYKWSVYDPIVAAANHYHLKVIGILDYAPGWAAHDKCAKPELCAPKVSAQFADFAAQTTRHYKQSIQDWEIWNEENSSQYWSPAPSVEQYASVLKQSYRSIKAVNPAAMVILGGMTEGDNSAAKEIDAVTFLKQLYQDGAKGSFDAVGYHPYTYPRTPFDANTAWTKLASLRSVMQAHGDAGKQIWITEYGAPTDGPPGSSFVSETAQAQLARDAYQVVQGKSWIGPFFWYTYQDKGSSTSTIENFYGLRRADGTPKPAYYTWKQLLAE